MALTEGTPVTYGEHTVGNYEYSVDYRIKELKQKIVSKSITDEEKDELKLLATS